MKVKLFVVLAVFLISLSVKSGLAIPFDSTVSGQELPSLRPPCGVVQGTGAITMTTDNGASLLPTSENLRGIGYTYGLTALRTPGTLLAVHNAAILRSTNNGCSWDSIGDVDTSLGDYFPLKLVAGAGDRAFGWSENRTFLIRIDRDRFTYLKAPVEGIIGIGTDPDNADHVRIGDSSGILESFDGGDTWQLIASLPKKDGAVFPYRVAFAPENLNHILVGTVVKGAFVTTDGGRNWQQATGFNGKDKSANVFEFAISPVNDNIVWAMGINLTEANQGTPSGGRHIYLSANGGQTFYPVIDHSATVTIRNQPAMAAHPTNPGVLYFVFGTYYQDYGTDVFRYNLRDQSLTKTHNSYDGIDSITFSRKDPSIMYFGLEVVEPVGP